MTQLPPEELRDEVLSLFEEKEDQLLSYTKQVEKIEDEGVELFERKVISIKNRLINDANVSDEELQEKYLEEIAIAKKIVLEEVEAKIKELVEKQA